MEPAAECCGSCGFSLSAVDRIFGPVPRHHAVLNDMTGVLSPGASKRILRLADRLRARFPQVFPTVFFARMPENAHALAFAYWLINRCRFTPNDPKGGENFGLLIFVDPEARQASIVTGYGLEHYFDTDQLGAILDQMEPLLRRSNWGAAVLKGMRLLFSQLEKSWRSAPRQTS